MVGCILLQASAAPFLRLPADEVQDAQSWRFVLRAGIPLLVLGNKNDLPGALGTTDLIDRLDLKASPSRPHHLIVFIAIPYH